ncbi:MAG: hypothetical protein M3N18_12845 [Actinomycetota bacterium]|nr:hypothetical protein [Actinomycetota bacterium]
MDGTTCTNALFENWLVAAWPAVTLFAAGTLFVVLVLFYFLKEERYRRPPRPERGVEFVVARRAVEARISALAPRMMLLAEKEKSVAGHLRKGTSSEETWRTVERLLRDVARSGFWERFVEASALADYDPAWAHEELRRLSAVAETALEKLERAEEVIRGREDDKQE